MRVLVAGWFSFDEVIATVGDELGADVVVGWLTERGIPHEVHSGVSVYVRDPDGARIELIADPLGEMYGSKVL